MKLIKNIFALSALTLATSTAMAQGGSSAQEVMREYDEDNDQTLSQQEFRSLYQEKLAGNTQGQQGSSSSGGQQARLIVGIGSVDDVYRRWAGEDNELSIEEWDNAVDQMFGEDQVNLQPENWDQDGNGSISNNEFQQAISSSSEFQMASASGSQGGSQQNQQPPQFSQADQDGNGELSIEEAKQAMPSSVQITDTNNDGTLSRSEAESAIPQVSFTGQGNEEDPVKEQEYQQIRDSLQSQ